MSGGTKDNQMSRMEMLKMNIRALGAIGEMDQYVVPLSILFGISIPLIPNADLFLTSLLVNELTGNRDIALMTRYLVMLAAVNLLFFWLQCVFINYRNYRASNLWERSRFYLNKKILQMDYENLEKDEIRNQRRDIDEMEHKSGGGGINYLFWRIDVMVGSFLMLVISGVLIIRMLKSSGSLIVGNLVLSLLGAATLFLLLAAGAFWMMQNVKKKEKRMFDLYMENVPRNRLFGYYARDYLLDGRSGKDVRIFSQQGLIFGQMKRLSDAILQNHADSSEAAGKADGKNAAVNVLMGGLIYLYLGVLALNGAIGIGDIVLYAGCVTNFIKYFHEFTGGLAELSGNTRYLKQYFDFLDIPNRKKEGALPVEKRRDNRYEIEFKDVSFRYPGTAKDALSHISLKFHVGEKLAVVGPNGSGKTTFIKLLCRLYDPTEGEILLNGVNIQEYRYEEYMSLFSVVFQDFQLLSFPLGHNVAASDMVDEKRAIHALEQAGMGERLSKMEEGLSTWLYKEGSKNGVELSGGEAQKTGIARALYRDAPFIVLDEPTAALDPLSEYEIYARFDGLIQGKTAVYISHRLSSCRFCHDIAVFEDGALIERGSHEELLGRQGSFYGKLWEAQAKYYIQ